MNIKCNGFHSLFTFSICIGIELTIIELINIETWEKAKEVIQDFIANPDKAEIYKQLITTNWIKWKSDLTRFSPFSGFF